MSANKIAETSTSTGTGNFTLSGAWSQAGTFNTGNRTFNSFYGLNHYFPYMIQDQLGNWEKGVGYLSDSTTLVRETITDNSLSTTALIDFSAGEKLVMVPTDAGGIWPETLDSGKYITSGGLFGFTSSTITLAANMLQLSLFNSLRPMAVSGLTVDVTTQAGQGIKAIIYKAKNQNNTSMTTHLVAAGSAVTLSATGRVSLPITANIGQGLYFVGVVSDGTPSIRSNASNNAMFNGFDNGMSGNIVTGMAATVGGSYVSPPETRTGGWSVSASSIRVGLEGRFL